MNVTTSYEASDNATEKEDGDEDNLPQTKGDPGPAGRSQATMKLTGKRPQTMEVWFAGTHSDM